MKPKYIWIASHLRTSVDTEERCRAVHKAKGFLAESGLRIDLLVATGISGTVFGTSLADAMCLPIAIVRKDETPRAHSSERVEGPDADQLDTMHWVFVDDIISSGATFCRVCACMQHKYGSNQKLVGVLLHGGACYYGLNCARVDVPVFDCKGPYSWEKEWKEDEVPRPAVSGMLDCTSLLDTSDERFST